jgi:DNA-binding transcriptional regulator GbsR (MarR family)
MSEDDAQRKLHFVEEIGLVFEEAGMTRMAGRILGWLLICDPPHQTLNDLAEVLQASKGSISTMTRLLIQTGLVERVSLPGQRRDYFRIRPGAWVQIMVRRIEAIRAIREMAERGLALLEGADGVQRRRLDEFHSLYTFLERKMPELLVEWQQKYARQLEAR